MRISSDCCPVYGWPCLFTGTSPLPPFLLSSVWLALPLDQDSFFGGAGVEGMGRCEKWVIEELTGVAVDHHANFGHQPVQLNDCAAVDFATRQELPGVGLISAQASERSQRAVQEDLVARQGVCFTCGERGGDGAEKKKPLKCSGCSRVTYCRW